MPLAYPPKPGMIVMCDFTSGSRPPEMTKVRPVIVLSPGMSSRSGLTTVVSLSTTPPDPVEPFHLKVPCTDLPMLDWAQRGETWVKGDMVNAVALSRLNLLQLGSRDARGRRRHFTRQVSAEFFAEVIGAVLAGLGLCVTTDNTRI